MSVNQYQQLDPWEAPTGTKDKGWLALLIREHFWSWVGNAEPSPTTWTRIKERLLRLQQRRRLGVVAQIISEAASHSAAETGNLDAASRSKNMEMDDCSGVSSRS